MFVISAIETEKKWRRQTRFLLNKNNENLKKKKKIVIPHKGLNYFLSFTLKILSLWVIGIFLLSTH